jgi:mono/diheme cytochrome c family protein
MFWATCRAVFVALIVVPGLLQAQTQPTPAQQASTKGMKLDTGEEIFKASCAGCHGPRGEGQPETILGFEPPPAFPDFTDCNGSTREKTFDWNAIIHEGGPIRAFSEIMPSWKDALTDAQIDKLTQHLRTLCDEPGWPLGELNFPRAMFTEKAFPEDEWLFRTTVAANGPAKVSSRALYEKRIGARSQVEFGLPFSFLQRGDGTAKGWVGGVGDFSLGYKRVLMSRIRSGSILSVQGELILPTGNRTKDLGSGVTTFEPFLAFGQILPGMGSLQMQSGFELHRDSREAPDVFFWKGALGKSFAQQGGVGRMWTPMVEFLADRDLESDARTFWDVAPQVQITLNQRQHVRLNVGVRTPMNHTSGRSTQLAFYLLWDTFDGALWEGW